MKLTVETGQNNAILRTKSTPVKTTELHLYRTLSEAMLTYIKNPKNKGIGLAAPQSRCQ
jgi:peptide deformylase